MTRKLFYQKRWLRGVRWRGLHWRQLRTPAPLAEGWRRTMPDQDHRGDVFAVHGSGAFSRGIRPTRARRKRRERSDASQDRSARGRNAGALLRGLTGLPVGPGSPTSRGWNRCVERMAEADAYLRGLFDGAGQGSPLGGGAALGRVRKCPGGCVRTILYGT